jgi:hypothetical protein
VPEGGAATTDGQRLAYPAGAAAAPIAAGSPADIHFGRRGGTIPAKAAYIDIDNAVAFGNLKKTRQNTASKTGIASAARACSH